MQICMKELINNISKPLYQSLISELPLNYKLNILYCLNEYHKLYSFTSLYK